MGGIGHLDAEAPQRPLIAGRFLPQSRVSQTDVSTNADVRIVQRKKIPAQNIAENLFQPI